MGGRVACLLVVALRLLPMKIGLVPVGVGLILMMLTSRSGSMLVCRIKVSTLGLLMCTCCVSMLLSRISMGSSVFSLLP